MPKTTKKPAKSKAKAVSFSLLKPNSPLSWLTLLFVLLFAVLGVYLLLRSRAQVAYSGTALTVVASDGVTSNAMCVNNYVASGGNNFTPCIQVNPSNATQVRTGQYNIDSKQFAANGPWFNLSNPGQSGNINVLTCPVSHHTFVGLGAINTPYGVASYGEEVLANGNTNLGFFNVTANGCVSSPGGTLVNSQWAKPVVDCTNGSSTVHVYNDVALESAVANRPAGTEICVGPGTYHLNATLIPKSGMKIVGDPINRAVIDAGGINTTRSGKPFQRSGFLSTGATNVTIANLVVANAQTQSYSSCPTCGMGIYAGPNWLILNDKVINNKENGIHTVNYLDVENTEMSGNGIRTDVGWSSAALKTTVYATLKNNVVVNNVGVGLWCDVGCNGGVWTVSDNYVAGNARGGIRYETSGGSSSATAKITNNVVVGNNTDHTSYNGGIEAVDAQDVIANYNTLRNNTAWGMVAIDDQNPRGGYVHLGNITFGYNKLNGQSVKGCSASGSPVNCVGNQ